MDGYIHRLAYCSGLALLFDQLYKRTIITIDGDKYYMEDLNIISMELNQLTIIIAKCLHNIGHGNDRVEAQQETWLWMRQ